MKAFVPKSGKWAGRAVLTSTNTKLKSFRQEVSSAALVARQAAGFTDVIFGKHEPVTIFMRFVLQKPPSVAKKREKHVVKPDLSKLLRATEDALTGIIYADDAQIIGANIGKEYGSPERVEIEVS